MSDVLSKINPRARELAEKIEAAITLDDDGASVLPETFVSDNLPEELNLDVIRKVQDEEAAFGAGLLLGLGNKSMSAMEADKNLTRTTATLAFGNNNLKAAVDRATQVRNPQTGEERTKFGSGQLKLESGASAKRGDLKKVIQHITESYTASGKF